jgi:hypothetical protein
MVQQRCILEGPAHMHSSWNLLDERARYTSFPACLFEYAAQGSSADLVALLAICDGNAATLCGVSKHVMGAVFSVEVPTISLESAQNLSNLHDHFSRQVTPPEEAGKARVVIA